MSNQVLFASPKMVGLANNIRSGLINDETLPLADVEWRAFRDGWPNLFIYDIKKYRGCDAYFLASFSTPADIFAQLGVIYALARYEVRSLTVILPFFSTGTMERVEVEGEIATAMTLARMLDAIPEGGPGFGRPRIIIYDIHALAQRFFFHGVLPRLESALPLLMNELKLLQVSGDRVCVVFPDDGAQKRFGKALIDYPQVVCGKVRRVDNRIITIKEGDPAGCHAVIVDDLVQTGGTLFECGKVLKTAGAQKVSAYVTHGIFPKESWIRFMQGEEKDRFENFWFTDSCPQMASDLNKRPPFKVLSLAPLLRDLILTDNIR